MKIPQSVFDGQDAKWTQAAADCNGDVWLYTYGKIKSCNETGEWLAAVVGTVEMLQTGVNLFEQDAPPEIHVDWWHDSRVERVYAADPEPQLYATPAPEAPVCPVPPAPKWPPQSAPAAPAAPKANWGAPDVDQPSLPPTAVDFAQHQLPKATVVTEKVITVKLSTRDLDELLTAALASAYPEFADGDYETDTDGFSMGSLTIRKVVKS